ncbi:COP9 signalosome complex subunit 3-like isoform X1 [Brassica napus]|uniref:COP9 signalosome complex subunit 3-like isoform X1 n=1 Tax=Brassica napus TaxID=3708 RepID=UPI000BBE4337|nr:COP9 signalosome complex subunit 3-like isoform X1 [Brassica napus]
MHALVVTLCKRFKDRVLELKDPIRGVAPLVSAVRKVQVSANCSTVLHPDCLQLCLQAKCYKAGYDGMNGIGLKRFQKTSELHYNPYYEVGNRYNDGKISELEAVVVAQSSDLEQDKDTGLVKQAVSSLYKRNILGLTHKYLTLSLQDIVNMMVQTANAKEAETHVIQMIQDGQIHALINQKDGMVRLLEDPEQYKTSEMIEVMVSVIQRLEGKVKGTTSETILILPLRSSPCKQRNNLKESKTCLKLLLRESSFLLFFVLL